jgi:hypothetical protein
VATPRPFGSFPVGVWGLPQDPNDRKVPKGEMVEALDSLDLACVATPAAGGPEIPYYQVEIGRRKPLPFARRTAVANQVRAQAQQVADLVEAPATVAGAYQTARAFLQSTATPTGLAALRGGRTSPPLLGTLAERIEAEGSTVVPEIGAVRAPTVYDHFIDPPVAVGILSGTTANLRVAAPTRTTVKDSARAWRTAPPTLAKVEAERSKSIAARLVLTDAPAASTGRAGTVIAATHVPPSAVARATPVLVARPGSPGLASLGAFSGALVASSQLRARSTGATLLPGQTVVLRMPNARRDAAFDAERPQLAVTGVPARVVVLASGGAVMADRVLGGDGAEAAIEIGRGAERIVAVGSALQDGAAPGAGLAGWSAGMQLPYVGWSTAVGPGCVVRSTLSGLTLHRERVEAGWITGAELAAGITTVTTTFSDFPATVVVALDDPAAFGDPTAGRQLLLGLDGAVRAKDAAGRERAPVLLTMENRSVLAYDIVPDGDKAVVVTIASDAGWSLVGVMGSTQLDATGAIALISARGLDASIRPLSTSAAEGASRLEWRGPTRTEEQRLAARALASRRPPMETAPTPAVKTKPKKRTRKPAAKKTAEKTEKSTATRRTKSSRSPRGKGETR